ncbi:phosphatidate cytidylyltransferase [Hyphomicrobium sp.]|uniref:phosphatidate cytidylyltransferase n=1 Tax=Hyphomicrobium sp. TaxID=82 RepID=UPI0025BED869|nr:phosphatidate cytidylyltransferase [Hyphomicrobium sp.]MCC7251859.1 phosphatidate cytidylyltransferase [Hyphomicrobium sp.]
MEDNRALGSPPDEIVPPRPSSNVWLRIVSAIGLAIIAFAAAWAGVLPFACVVLAVALIMSWEWSSMVRGGGIDVSLVVHALAVAAAVSLAAFGFAALGVAALLIGTIIVLALEFGSRPILSAAGVLYAGLPAVALLWLRGSEPLGFQAVLFIVLVVAATDTAAFAAGRLIGGPRLAPAVSPNKTWSGLVGGLSAASATAALFAYATSAPVAALAIIGLVMGLIAQAGDLAESAMKRAFNIKDVSQLLPGHGGFMDRMDGLAPVAVAVALAVLFLDPQAPAEALLAGLTRGAP